MRDVARVAGGADMDYLDHLMENRGGFNFENCARNSRLVAKHQENTRFPKAKKTGTTICGIIIANGVVLAADTRATAGEVVADKNCDKLHPIAPNIQCAGAGTSADLDATTKNMERQLEMHSLNTGTQPRVCTVVKKLSNLLFRYQGHVGCALVLGGVDISGPHLYQIYPHGSTDMLPYTTMGSGSLAAMSVLEMGYKEGLDVESGKRLVADAIRAGILNDLGSGGNVDVCSIVWDAATKKVVKNHTRAYDTPCLRKFKTEYPPFRPGQTPCLGSPEIKLITTTNADEDDDVVMVG